MRVNKEQFSELCSTGKIISSHAIYGPKVVLLPNGNYLKVFNPKSGLTKRHFFPKYKAFIRNAQEIQARGIPCVHIKASYFLTEHQSHAVLYEPLQGTDLRTLAHENLNTTLENFIPFLVKLHEKGIYFRGMHLGNVLKLDNGQYGLIDVADVYFSRGSLNIFKRIRNLKHLLQNNADKVLYQQFGVQKLLNNYYVQAKLPFFQKILFSLIAKRPACLLSCCFYKTK